MERWGGGGGRGVGGAGWEAKGGRSVMAEGKFPLHRIFDFFFKPKIIFFLDSIFFSVAISWAFVTRLFELSCTHENQARR